MDSDDITDEDEQESISKQIVDYYRKYSQSRELPKYLSGNSLSYMPKIVPEDDKVQIQSETVSETLTEARQMIDSLRDENNDEEKPVSPSSSTVSTRKLEWDNGADIGYVNYEKIQTNILHKSNSLPTVLTESKKNDEKTTQTQLSNQILTIISHSSSSEYLKDATAVQYSSSSTSPSFPIQKPPISSSSSSNYPSKVPSSSSSSLATTLAYIKSKIGDPGAESTPKIFEKPPVPQFCETPIVKTSKKQGKKRIFELCRTKPILIECIDNKKKGSDKIIQTSFREAISEAIQTSDSLLESPTIPVQNNQSIIIIDDSEESEKRTVSNAQTDSEAISLRSEGFEYLAPEQIQNQETLLLKSTALSSSTEGSSIPLLAQLISQNQSQSLVGDVDKSIVILQKLLKSKKYDDATKKRYIKKIVQKIIDSKYSEDSSTTSSELFLPKRDAKNQKLNENLPWVPPQLSKFTIKTETDEFLPEKSDQQQSKKKSIFTVSNSPVQSFESSLEKSSSWKEDKTMSERMLETQKHCGQGDQLVKFAQKERQHQLAWISDEISHLTKLKGLLEIAPKTQKTTTVYMLSHNRSPNKKNSGRNYIIETELAGGSSSDSISFNFQDNNGNKNYHVRTGKSAHESNSRKLVGNIEVVSDEKSTNIKVKTKRVEDPGEFAPKRPSLVGEGKYDTFPRSQREDKTERCWPCGMPVRRLPEVETSWPSGMPKARKHSLHSQGSNNKYVVDVPLSQIRTTLSNLNKISNQKLRQCSDSTQCVLDCECKSKITEIPEATCLYQKEFRRDICSDGVQCEMGCSCKDKIISDKNIATLPLEKRSKKVQMDHPTKRRSSRTQYDPRFSTGTSESVQASVDSKNQVIETIPKETSNRNSQSSYDTNSVQIQYDPIESTSQNSQVQCKIRNDSRDQVSETVHVETTHKLVQKDPEQAANRVTQYESNACSESVQCKIACDCKQNIQNRDKMIETHRRSYMNKNVQESDDFHDNSRRIFEQQIRKEEEERRKASRCSGSVQCEIGCRCKDVCSKLVQCEAGCECKSHEFTAISERIRERKAQRFSEEEGDVYESRDQGVRFYPNQLQNNFMVQYSELRNVQSDSGKRRHVCDKADQCEVCDRETCENSVGKCVLCKRFVQHFDSDVNRNQEEAKTRQRLKGKLSTTVNQVELFEDRKNLPVQTTAKTSSEITIQSKESAQDQTLPPGNLENTKDGQKDQQDDVYLQSFVNIFGVPDRSNDTIHTIQETTEKQQMFTIPEVSESHTESRMGSTNLRTSKELQTDSVSDSESTSSNVNLPLRQNELETEGTTSTTSKSSVGSSLIPEIEEQRKISKQISEKIQKTGSFDSGQHQCRVGDEIDELVASRAGPGTSASTNPKKMRTNITEFDSLSATSQQKNRTDEPYRKGNRQNSLERTNRNHTEEHNWPQHQRTGFQSGYVGNYEESRHGGHTNFSKDSTNRGSADRNGRNQRSSARNYEQDDDFDEEDRHANRNKREEQSRRNYINEPDFSQRGYDRNQRTSARNYTQADDLDQHGRTRPKPHNFSKDSTYRAFADKREEQSRRNPDGIKSNIQNRGGGHFQQDDILRDQTSGGSHEPSYGFYRERPHSRPYFSEPDDNFGENRMGEGRSRRNQGESGRFNREQTPQDKCIVCCDCKENRGRINAIFSGESIPDDNRNRQSEQRPIGHSFSEQAYNDADQLESKARKHRVSQDSKRNFLKNEDAPVRRTNTCICTPENLPVYEISACICRPPAQKVPNCICYSGENQNYERSGNLQDGNNTRRDYRPKNYEQSNRNKLRENERKNLQKDSTGSNESSEEAIRRKDSNSDLNSQRSDESHPGKANSSKIKNGINFREDIQDSGTINDHSRNKNSQKESTGGNRSSEEVGRRKGSNSDSTSQRSDDRPEKANSSKNKNSNFREDVEYSGAINDHPRNKNSQKDSTGRNRSTEEVGGRKNFNSDSTSQRSDEKAENQNTDKFGTRSKNEGNGGTFEESGRRRDSNVSSTSQQSGNKPEKADSNLSQNENRNESNENKPSESSEDNNNGKVPEEKMDQVSILSTSSSSGSSSSDSSSDSGSRSSCLCCKRNKLPSKTLYQLEDTINNQVIPLCRPCYRRYQVTPQNVYSNPTHICGCYSIINKQTLDEIKKTINDLNEINNECYCSCANVKNLKSSKYCKHCKCKLKKTTKSQNGIAYMLTFEETKPGENLNNEDEEKEKKKPLEEIKIKIPVTYKKKHKEKANKKKKKKKKKEEEQEEQARVVNLCSLQEYLLKNRPDFVEIAECRRKSMMDSRCEREESSEMKKMRFLLNYSSQPEKTEKYAKPRLFSAKEVREINKKNYKKLPEVQQKLVDNKEKQLRQANRLIADTFNKKLRDNVLKGKLTISADVNVVNL